MTETQPEGPSARELAARVAARADLIDVRLVEGEVKIHRIPAPEEHMVYEVGIHPSVETNVQDGRLVVFAGFKVQIGETDDPEPGEEDEPLGSVECAFAALFTIDDGDLDAPIDASELEAFALSSGVMALYPYARQFVQDMTARAGLPPLILNLLKVSIPSPEALRSERN